MENIKQFSQSLAEKPRWNKYLLPIALILILVIAILAWKAQPAVSTTLDSNLISQAAFEEQSGLKVHLIGVSGGGGMVDFRLKMIDAEKARLFLQDPAHLPVILISADGTQILAADTMAEEIAWADGGILFMMLSNNDGLIKADSPVIVKFGDLKLEPFTVQ